MSPSRAHALLRILPDIETALRDGNAVVALESSVLAQGLPVPQNREAADRMDRAVRSANALPAITAVVAGVPTIGLERSEASNGFFGATAFASCRRGTSRPRWPGRKTARRRWRRASP